MSVEDAAFLATIKNEKMESLLRYILYCDDYAPDTEAYRTELKRRADVMVDSFIEDN